MRLVAAFRCWVAGVFVLALHSGVRAQDDATNAPEAQPTVSVEEEPAVRRPVALLPLFPGGTVTQKQARGVTAQLRRVLAALEEEGALLLLPATKADDVVVRKCEDDDVCFEGIARSRGAERLARGVIEPADGGLRVTLRVSPTRVIATTIVTGGPVDVARFDRLAREAFAEDTLRGALRIEGQPGDVVTLDGRRQGALPTEGFLVVERLREGEHQLLVTRPESKNGTQYEPSVRPVFVRHAEQEVVKVFLLPVVSSAALDGSGVVPSSSLLDTLSPPVIAAFSTGAVLVVGGATSGVLSQLDARAVQQRAADEQLFFPRDEPLYSRGQTWAWVANALYAAGLLACSAGALLWWSSPSPLPSSLSGSPSPPFSAETAPLVPPESTSAQVGGMPR
jgi:hypothetical protein